MVEKSYQLIMQRGPKPGQVFQLLTRTITIGRDPMVDVVINDPEVSRQQVRLVRTDAGYQIQDLGSTNGTFINGRRLGGEPHLLQVGEEILLGSSITLLYMDAPDSDSLPVSPPAATMALDTDIAQTDGSGTPDEEEGDDSPFAPPIAAPDSLPAATEATPDTDAVADEGSDLFDFTEAEEPEFDLPGAAEPETDPSANVDDLWQEASWEEASWEEAASPASTPVDAHPPEPYAATSSPPPRFAAAPDKQTGAPPLVPPGASQASKRRNRTLTWVLVVVALLMVCCCAFVLSAYYVWGDPLMRALGVY